MPELDPSILLLIAQHVKRPVEIVHATHPGVERDIIEDKAALVKMMKTSKAMYELVAPVLYKDCITGDYPSFAAGLRTNDNTDRTARLHIHHKRYWDEATYEDIIIYGWEVLEIKNDLYSVPTTIRPEIAFMECDELVEEGKRLRRFVTEGLTILPNLQSVSMGGLGEDFFNGRSAATLEALYHCQFEKYCKVLPHAFIDLPTVQYYCQGVTHGPLALPNKVIKPASPLQTFTFHPRAIPMFNSCLTHQEKHSPPIILGAVNRYFIDLAVHVAIPLDTTTEAEVHKLVAPIVAMFTRPNVVAADPTTGTPIPCHNIHNINIYDGTVVEIYDYVRTIELAKIDPVIKSPFDPEVIHQTMPPQSLASIQAILDRGLPVAWKGRVVLKYREEAPPCPACGFDLMEDFQETLAFHNWMRASKAAQASRKDIGHAQ